VLCVGEKVVSFGVSVFAVCGRVCFGFGGVSVCCVLDGLILVWVSERDLCVGQIVLGLWE